MPKDATAYIEQAGHKWYFKEHKKVLYIYYRHDWTPYHATCFNFNILELIEL